MNRVDKSNPRSNLNERVRFTLILLKLAKEKMGAGGRNQNSDKIRLNPKNMAAKAHVQHRCLDPTPQPHPKNESFLLLHS